MVVLGLIVSLAFSAVAATSGTCGNNLTWVFDRDTGTLTISGTGAMQDNPIWNNVSGAVKTVKIGEGVTSIGASAFREFYSLTKVEFPDRMERIGASAFCDCTALKDTNMPETIESVGNYAFFGDSNLAVEIIFENRKGAGPLTIGVSAFEFSGITCAQLYGGDITVLDYAFANCKNLRCEGRIGKAIISPLSGLTLTSYTG